MPESPPRLPPSLDVPPPVAPIPYVPLPQMPAPPLDEIHNAIGLAQQAARAQGLQARILWIDATANIESYNTAEKIAALVTRIKRTGFNVIVLDVKPIVGYTLYPSKYAPKLTEWKGRHLPANFDPAAVFVAQAHTAGLQLVASMNVFSEGHRDFKLGPGYEAANAKWQTTLYDVALQVRNGQTGGAPFPLAGTPNRPAKNDQEIAVYTATAGLKPSATATLTVLNGEGEVVAQMLGSAVGALERLLPAKGAALVGEGAAGEWLRQNAPLGQKLQMDSRPVFVPISERPDRAPLMVNPNRPDVQERMRAMLTEFCQRYAVDGVIFDDRMRYAGLNADFSAETRGQFEKYLGRKVQWPAEILHVEAVFPTLARRTVPGPLFEAWQIFRALTIRNWFASAVATVKAIRPQATVSVYYGSWYADAPASGLNWAADDFQAGFRFLSDSYRLTGLAGLADWITTGCYYDTASIGEALAVGKSSGATVEAAGQLSNRAGNDQTWVYAGISLQNLFRQPEALRGVLQAALASTQGVMIFDLSYFNDTFWQICEEAFRSPAVPPHAVPGLLTAVRRQHQADRANGLTLPPVILYNGVPGTGL